MESTLIDQDGRRGNRGEREREVLASGFVNALAFEQNYI